LTYTQIDHSKMQVACIYLRVSTEEQDLTRQEGIEQSARAACYYIAGIYREKASGFLAKGPVRSVRIPAHLRETDKTTMTWDQLRAALSKLGLRDRILLEFDMSNALRPGELFGLRWKCFDPAVPSITIMETTYKGKIRPWGKTRGSLTTTPIATELAAELVEWTKLSKDPSPEAFIFPNRVGGFLDSSNFRNRVLHKLAEELELPKLTFQVIRRSIATMQERLILRSRLLRKPALTNQAGVWAIGNVVPRPSEDVILSGAIRTRRIQAPSDYFGSEIVHGKRVSHSEPEGQWNHSDGQTSRCTPIP